VFVLTFWGSRTSSSATFSAIGVGIFVLAAPVAAWTAGGLEQPMMGLLLGAAIAALLRVLDQPRPPPIRFAAPGVLLGLLCLVRPDAPLFCGAAGIAVLWVQGKLSERIRRTAVLAIGPLVALVVQTSFRLIYYGAWVPNTAFVKLSPSERHLADGLEYVAQGWLSLAPAAIVAACAVTALCRRTDRRPAAAFLVMAPLVWTIYLVVIGGGIFPAFRHFVPIVVVLAAATVHSGAAALSVLSGHHRRIWTGLAVTILALWYTVAQASGAEYRRALESSWVWAGHGVSLMLRDAFAARDPLLAVTAAGCIPYWTELPCIDMLGLNDPHIARSRPADLGEGRIGHEHGDGAYVLVNWSGSTSPSCSHDLRAGDRQTSTPPCGCDARTLRSGFARPALRHRYPPISSGATTVG
jgi:hypothetical protein